MPGDLYGAAVTFGEPFACRVDLMELDPAPARVLSIVVEGGGWDPRIGEVYEVMLTVGS